MKNNLSPLLVIIIIALHTVAFIYQLLFQNFYLSDSYEYLQEADNILNKGIFYSGDLNKTLNIDLFTKRPPLYPLFISFIKLFAENDLAILFFQNLLSLFNVFLLLRFVNPYIKGSGVLILMFFILSPVQIIYANLIMSEILLQTIILLIFLNFLNFVKYKKPLSFLYVSLLLVLGIFTKPVMAPFTVIFIFTGIIYFFKFRKAILLIYAILPFFLMLTYNYHNMKRTGYFHFSSIQNINLVNYNLYFFLSNIHGQDTAELKISLIHEKANKIHGYKEKQHFLRDAATEVILENKMKYLFFHVKGMIRFFLDPGRFDIFKFFALEEEPEKGFLYIINRDGFGAAIKQLFSNQLLIITVLIANLFLNGLKLIGLLYFAFMRGVSLEIRIAIILLIFYISFLTGPLGASRFLLPVLPLIILAASSSFSGIYKRNLRFLSLSPLRKV